jgi:hypothetical protein
VSDMAQNLSGIQCRWKPTRDAMQVGFSRVPERDGAALFEKVGAISR